jgi:hypothetical protein
VVAAVVIVARYKLSRNTKAFTSHPPITNTNWKRQLAHEESRLVALG